MEIRGGASQATISATVLDFAGKLVMEDILEANTATMLQFIHAVYAAICM